MWEGNPSEDPASKIWLHCFSLECRVLQGTGQRLHTTKVHVSENAPHLESSTAREKNKIKNKKFLDSRSHLVKFVRLLLNLFARLNVLASL